MVISVLQSVLKYYGQILQIGEVLANWFVCNCRMLRDIVLAFG